MSKWLEEREEFWADVKAMLCKCDRSVRIVVLSDFNDWVGVGVQRDGCRGFLFHVTRTHPVRPGARTDHNGFLPSFPFAREETQKSASIAVALRQPHVKLVLRYRSRNIHAVYHFCPYREKSFLRGGKRRNSRCVLTQRVEKSPLQYDTILR
ncbi:hypothetical protein EVAR_90895_1 [Eumeta japonica]|uniref:Uncharacterized protein n=1 Tax=Eumeta variegata TaxID=151549 RepID=A0A4C1ZSV4_EUMVA|nr:hypothetical protein EVAR_90895_1 [Eumeta japonica]